MTDSVDVSETLSPTPTDVAEPTESGGGLPNTSLPWGNELLLGGGLVLLGVIGLSSKKLLVK